jgi:hypothetical protein
MPSFPHEHLIRFMVKAKMYAANVVQVVAITAKLNFSALNLHDCSALLRGTVDYASQIFWQEVSHHSD